MVLDLNLVYSFVPVVMLRLPFVCDELHVGRHGVTVQPSCCQCANWFLFEVVKSFTL